MGIKAKGGKEVKNLEPKVRHYFTGVADAEVLKFNPTKQEIMEIKGIENGDNIKDPEYKTSMRDQTYRRIEIMMRIDPNVEIGKKTPDGKLIEEYAKEHYFNLTFLISDRDETSMGGNFRFINDRLQSTWGASLDAIKNNPKMAWFKTENARKAKEGEVQLYDFLYAWYSKSSSKEDPITDFVLGGDAQESWETLFSGDVTQLNNLIGDSEFSHPDGKHRKVAVLLGVEVSDSTDANGNYYLNQRVFTNKNINTFAKESRDVSKAVKDSVEEGRFKATIQDTFAFKVYDPSKTVEPKNEIKDIPDGDNFDILTDDDFV
jgi:hypothetical protein